MQSFILIVYFPNKVDVCADSMMPDCSSLRVLRFALVGAKRRPSDTSTPQPGIISLMQAIFLRKVVGDKVPFTVEK